MKTFFTVKTAAYEGPELGPKDTISVEIQRYDALGLIKSREKLVAMVVGVETLVPTEPDLDRLKELEAMGDDRMFCEKSPDDPRFEMSDNNQTKLMDEGMNCSGT